jgi:hypothetical protein
MVPAASSVMFTSIEWMVRIAAGMTTSGRIVSS